MSAWADAKTAMRRTVHDARKEAGTYSPPSGPSVPVNVRLHEGNKLIGDLDREGYGEVVSNMPRIIFDAAEAVPVYGGLIELTESGRSFTVEVVRPTDGPIEIVCEVTEVLP